jgi:hypothetical protein
MAFLFIPPCDHHWVSDPWQAESLVCLYCSEPAEEVAKVTTSRRIEPPTPIAFLPPLLRIDWSTAP